MKKFIARYYVNVTGVWFSTRQGEVSDVNIIPFCDDNGEG